MKKFISSNKSFFILGALTACISAVFAYSYLAGDISFTSKDTTWEVNNVSSALDSIRTNQGYGTYSLTEKPIGKWIDGRTVYEKVVPGQLPSTTAIEFPHYIENFGGLVKLDIIWYDTADNRWYTGTRYHNSGYGIGFEGISVNTKNVVISNVPNNINWAARSSNVYAIIRYYKTS